MKWLYLTVGCVLGLSLFDHARAVQPKQQETVTIPLDRIWAYKMPGTQDVSEIDLMPTDERSRATHMEMIRRQLSSEPPDHEAMTGFAISSKPRVALSFARHGITSRESPGPHYISAEAETFITFFSKACAYHLEIEKVERRGDVIDIRYRLVPRYSPESTIGFALIPLGELPAGEYHVEISQNQMEQKYLDAGFQPVSDEAARNIVCQPFSFRVEELVSPDPGHAKNIEPQDEEARERTISLSSIVTTGPQEGLQNVRDVLQQNGNAQKVKASDGYLRQILSGSGGSSNVFLVDATTIEDAIAASFSVLVGGRSVDRPAPVNTPDPKRGSHWSVAYLGSGPSNPTWWTIESVTVDKGKVMLSYRKSNPRSATRDVRRYYYWIPLGKLDPGAYELQLVDADKGTVTLTRRVEVALTNERGGTQ